MRKELVRLACLGLAALLLAVAGAARAAKDFYPVSTLTPEQKKI